MSLSLRTAEWRLVRADRGLCGRNESAAIIVREREARKKTREGGSERGRGEGWCGGCGRR